MSNEKSFEFVNTQWFDPDAIRLPNYKVGRVNYGLGRSYLRITDDGLETPFRLYTSLTTVISQCSPQERPLLEWYCKLGLTEADRQSRMSQHYGTLMHLLIGDFLKTGTFDFEAIGDKIKEYLNETNYWQPETDDWEEKLRYDVAAFIQFANDYKIAPLGIEYVLLSDRGYGTLIDLVCKMTVEEKGFWGGVYKSGANAGQPKETKQSREVIAVINFKSGRHGFWRSNGIQVECERLLWQENFPDVPVERCYNWSPKEWNTTPSYTLKDWTDEIEQPEIDAILMLADLRYGQKAMNKKFVSVSGQYYSTRGLDDCVQIKEVEQWCREKYSKILA